MSNFHTYLNEKKFELAAIAMVNKKLLSKYLEKMKAHFGSG